MQTGRNPDRRIETERASDGSTPITGGRSTRGAGSVDGSEPAPEVTVG